jgi:hypothetical protein
MHGKAAHITSASPYCCKCATLVGPAESLTVRKNASSPALDCFKGRAAWLQAASIATAVIRHGSSGCTDQGRSQPIVV